LDPRSEFIADSASIVSSYEHLYATSIRAKSVVSPIALGSNGTDGGWAKENLVLFIGRSDRRKSLGLLVAMWRLVTKHVPNWKLVIATSVGDDKEAWLAASSLGKSNSVSLFENADEETKSRLLSKARLVVVPSLYESFGIVAAEAQSFGCSVLAHEVGGLVEVVDARHLVKSQDPLVWAFRVISELRLIESGRRNPNDSLASIESQGVLISNLINQANYGVEKVASN
jgi:glycosyltransferase involved in cell wall biosynthesis